MPTANGRPLLAARIAEPDVGRWWAELEVSGAEPLTGAVTIDIDGVTWTGTVRSSADDGGRQRALVFGGADQLGAIVPDRQHAGSATLATVLGDLLRDAGEVLATAAQGSSATELARTVPHWQRLRQPALAALGDLARAVDLHWRVLRSGLIAAGVAATYPAATATVRVLAVDAAAEVLTVAVDAPLIEPGQSVDGHPIRRIEWTLTGDSLRGALYYGITAMAAGFESRSIWTAGLDSQRSDGSLDLIASSRYGLGGVPYYSGLPGVRVEPKPGASVLGGYAAGDPRAPVAFAARGTGGLKIGTLLAAVSPTGALLSLAFFDADAAGEAALITAIAAIIAAGNAPIPPTGLPLTFTTAVQQ